MRKDLLLSRRFAADIMMNSTDTLPFSFSYGGERIKGIPADWEPSVRGEMVDSSIMKTVVTGISPNHRIKVTFELTTYRDHSVCEWVVWLENVGTKDSRVMEDIFGADFSLPEMIEGDLKLWHGIAEHHSEKNYSFEIENMPPDKVFTFSPEGGRPCDGAFPYFRVFNERGGCFVAVGWPGEWEASFENWNSSVYVKAGQKNTDLYLQPGEKIRTPRITLMFFEGTEDYGVNLWRDWYRQHILPRNRNGKPIMPRWCGYARDPKGSEHCNETEYTQLDYIVKAKELGFHLDTWWIDAGWYDCSVPAQEARERCGRNIPADNPAVIKDWPFTGKWKCDPERFPRGMKPISDEIKKGNENADLLLWFEPERICNADSMFEDHPEFIITCPGEKANRMLNLANPECVKFLSRYISAFIKDNGIDVYRQDFNFSPKPFWEKNDADMGEHRVGITENFYIQGYLAYWDYLLADNPGLWIDSCASGGRRNDLETMRRAAPLHYSDYGYKNYVEKQRYHHMLYQWFMYFKDGACYVPGENEKNVDFYASQTSFAPMYIQPLAFPCEHDYTDDFKVNRIWKTLKPYFIDGSYHLLSKPDFTAESWTVYQFCKPEDGSGVVQFIRNEANEQSSYTAILHGIDPDADYMVTDTASGIGQKMLGSMLANGLTCSLEKRSATVIEYHKA